MFIFYKILKVGLDIIMGQNPTHYIYEFEQNYNLFEVCIQQYFFKKYFQETPWVNERIEEMLFYFSSGYQ